MRTTKQRDISVRFWEKVEKSDGCWNWTGGISGGYGRIRRSRREVRAIGGPFYIQAHRFAYEEIVGPIADGLQLDHKCRNQICVNPAHLEPVTQYVNLHRGVGYAATNAAKTHCDHGHEFTPANTRIKQRANGRTSRECRSCDADRTKAYKARQRELMVAA